MLRHASLLTGMAVGLALAFGVGNALDKYEHATARPVQMTGADVPDIPVMTGQQANQIRPASAD